VLAAVLVLAQAAASSITIAVSAPPVISACDAVEVRVTVTAPGHVAPQVTAPPLAPFQLVRRTTRPMVRFSSAGDPTITVEHSYVLASDRPGSYTLGPFRAELGGAVARSHPIAIAVRSAPGPTVPSVVADASIDTARDVNFRAVALPDTVYVGEQVQYEVAVFLREAVRERLRRNPTFYPPDMPGVLAYDLPARRGEPPRRRIGGRCFDALVYQRALFPLQPGRIVIPPAQLVYSLPAGPGLFSRDETHELQSDSVVVIAIAPPAAGRPANDIGAVGTLHVGARVDTTAGRVGDPLMLTVEVTGAGNVKLLPRPQLSLPWASLVPDGERVRIDSAGQQVRGSKEFDWLLTPRRGGELEIPALEYPHFDPSSGSYVVSRTEPLRLEIESAPLARLDTPVVRRTLALRATYRGPLGRPLYAHPAVWLLAAAAPLPALVGVVRGRRPRAARVPTPAESLARIASGPEPDARSVRRAFIAALSHRLRLPASAFTRSGAVERALRRSGVPRELAAEAEDLLRRLDGAAYGAQFTPFDARATARDAGRIYAEVDSEALARWELGPVVTLLLAITCIGTFAIHAIASPAGDAVEFSEAAAHYDAGRYAEAAAGFERLAARVPRAPDAWANYGTAAWAASDTAGAVVGWQRALRLEPGAGDVRGRLGDLYFPPFGAPGFVPPVGASTLALLALACWIAGFVLPLVARRRGRMHGGITYGLLASAVVIAMAAVFVDERLAADDVVVLRRGGGLSASPAIGARRDVRAETGEIARVGAREGGWIHVRFDGDRTGWVPASELIPLARASHGGS